MIRLNGWVAAVAVVLCAGIACAGETLENPFKSAKVGDWLKHTVKTETMGMTQGSAMLMTVKAKTPEEATVTVEMEAMGQKMPPQEQKIPLNEAYDVTKLPAQATAAGITAKVLGQGEETISVGGKSYACHWVESSMEGKVMGGMQVKGKSKIWICKDVPLSGMVKMVSETEMQMNGQPMKTSTTMEIAGTGSAAQ